MKEGGVGGEGDRLTFPLFRVNSSEGMILRWKAVTLSMSLLVM